MSTHPTQDSVTERISHVFMEKKEKKNKKKNKTDPARNKQNVITKDYFRREKMPISNMHSVGNRTYKRSKDRYKSKKRECLQHQVSVSN